jgi:hypothetical protein
MESVKKEPIFIAEFATNHVLAKKEELPEGSSPKKRLTSKIT